MPNKERFCTILVSYLIILFKEVIKKTNSLTYALLDLVNTGSNGKNKITIISRGVNFTAMPLKRKHILYCVFS